MKGETIKDTVDRHIGYAKNSLKANSERTDINIKDLNEYKSLTERRTEDLVIEAVLDYRKKEIVTIELLRRLLTK